MEVHKAIDIIQYLDDGRVATPLALAQQFEIKRPISIKIITWWRGSRRDRPMYQRARRLCERLK